MLDKQGNWKLKLCSHSFWIAKSWGIWLRSVVLRSRLFPRGNFWFVCLHCLIPFIFHHKLQAFSYSFALYKTEVDKKQTINWCTLHMYNSLWESFHSLDGTSESSSMIYFYSLRLIELPSSRCVTNSRKVFLFLLFFILNYVIQIFDIFAGRGKTLLFIVDLSCFHCFTEYYLHHSFQPKSLLTLLHSSKKVQIMLWIIISLIGYCQWQ